MRLQKHMEVQERGSHAHCRCAWLAAPWPTERTIRHAEQGCDGQQRKCCSWLHLLSASLLAVLELFSRFSCAW
jgi:hypothetical protein